MLKNSLAKVGIPSEILDFLFKWMEVSEDYPKVPEAKGSIRAVQSEAFFIPLYELYLNYGGIFRLTFGPKVSFLFTTLFGRNLYDRAFDRSISCFLLQSFVIVSDPSIAKHVLRDNSKAYSKVK